MKKLLQLFIAAALIMICNTQSFSQWSYNSSDIYFLNGRAGIGLTNPSYKLHVRTSNNLAAKFEFYNDPALHLQISESYGPQLDFGRPGTVEMKFRSTTDNVNYYERFRIQNTGNVLMGLNGGNTGIGTLTPAYKLDVNGTINATNILINGSPISSGSSQWTTSGTNLYWNNSGNLGIGITAPVTKLHVRSTNGTGAKFDFYNDPNIFLQLSESFGPRIDFGRTGGANLTFRSTINGGSTYAEVMKIDNNGCIAIGTSQMSTVYKLLVNGKIRTKEVNVEAGWSDFVFENDYKLLSLENLEKYIHENNHLPGIPTTEEVEKNGVNVGEISSKLLQKIEELTLYVIEQNNEIKKLKEKNTELSEKINSK